MNSFEKNILNDLLDAYERSKLSKEGTKVRRDIRFTTKNDCLKSYTLIDSYRFVDDNDAILRKLEGMHFIKTVYENDSFKSLTLNLEEVDSIYHYLGRKKPSEELDKIRKVLSSYHFDNFMDDFLSFVKETIDKKFDYPKKYFSDAEELKQILKAFQGIFELNDEMKKRDFSVKYLSDSKAFEKIENKVIKIIEDFDPATDLEKEDVLASYNIVKNSTYALLRHGLVLKLNDQVISLDALGYEFSLSDEMIKNLQILQVNAKKLITIENLTSFYQCDEKESILIYLGGFHNHTKQNLLKKIYEKAPNLTYSHFSDIDAGGFLIFRNLIDKTGIPFVPYKMSIQELKENKGKLKTLTGNDVKRLQDMLSNMEFSVFHETIQYMLENNCKLEQEALD